MGAATIVISILLILVAIILIVSVLMQEGSRQGLGSISGGAETFFGKSKAKSYEGKLALITKIAAGVFIVLAIVMTRMTAVSNNTETASAEDVVVEDTADEVEETADESAEDVTDEATEDAVVDEEAADEDEAVVDEATEEPVEEAAEESDE